MTPGFTVAELLPHGRGGAGLRMGLTRIDEAGWRRPDGDRAARAAAFDDDPDAVIALPGSEAAGREAAALVGVEGGLAEAARVGWEDLCLLLPDASGEHRLVAGAVGFPTDWRLADKIGRPLGAIHAPIHGYAEQLSAGVDHFVRTLRPGPIYARANWFVVPTGAWRYLPADDPARRFAGVTPASAGERLFVRCERQTIRRLPASGAILFGIGIAVERLGALAPDAVRRLATAVAAQPADERDRRDVPFYADALAGYAAALPLPATDAKAA